MNAFFIRGHFFLNKCFVDKEKSVFLHSPKRKKFFSYQ